MRSTLAMVTFSRKVLVHHVKNSLKTRVQVIWNWKRARGVWPGKLHGGQNCDCRHQSKTLRCDVYRCNVGMSLCLPFILIQCFSLLDCMSPSSWTHVPIIDCLYTYPYLYLLLIFCIPIRICTYSWLSVYLFVSVPILDCLYTYSYLYLFLIVCIPIRICTYSWFSR